MICEKEITIQWDLIDDLNETNIGEEVLVIRVYADEHEGLNWEAIKFTSDILGNETSTDFTDRLGRWMIARGAKWFGLNSETIWREDADFASYRDYLRDELKADIAWANTRSI